MRSIPDWDQDDYECSMMAWHMVDTAPTHPNDWITHFTSFSLSTSVDMSKDWGSQRSRVLRKSCRALAWTSTYSLSQQWWNQSHPFCPPEDVPFLTSWVARIQGLLPSGQRKEKNSYLQGPFGALPCHHSFPYFRYLLSPVSEAIYQRLFISGTLLLPFQATSKVLPLSTETVV